MFGNNLKELRKSRNLTMDEAVEKINQRYEGIIHINKGNLSRWENNKVEPKLSTVRVLADFYGLSVDDIVEGTFNQGKKTDISSVYNQLEEKRQTKVYNFAERQLEEQNKVVNLDTYSKKDDDRVDETLEGYVAAGTGEQLGETVAEPISISKSIIPEQPYDMILQVNGDSMEPMFEDHEYIFIHKTKEIRSGQIGVFIIDGESYLKKVYINDDHLRLVSLNKEYEDLIFDSVNDINLIGTVVM